MIVGFAAAIYAIERLIAFAAGFSLPQEMQALPALFGGFAAAVFFAFRRGDWREALGLAGHHTKFRTVVWAFAILVAFILVQNVFGIVASQVFDLPPPDMSRYDDLLQSPFSAFGFWLILIFTAAIPEELLFRGFVLGRFGEILYAMPFASAMAVILQAAMFGAIHFQWGLGGILGTTIMGLVWGTGFVLSGRNLWAVILAHSGAHLLLVIQLYLVASS